MSSQTKDLKSSLNQLEETLAEYFDKLPSLPDNIKETIVNLAPWLNLLLLVLLLITVIPGLLFLIGAPNVFNPFFYGGFYGGGFFQTKINYVLSLFVLGVCLVLEVLAIPGLFNRTHKGWQFVFYASLTAGVANLMIFNLLNLIIVISLSWYILFQIRSYYK